MNEFKDEHDQVTYRKPSDSEIKVKLTKEQQLDVINRTIADKF